jgi:hypothetical protein
MAINTTAAAGAPAMTRPHRKPALRNVGSLSSARDLRPRRPRIGRPAGTSATGPGPPWRLGPFPRTRCHPLGPACNGGCLQPQASSRGWVSTTVAQDLAEQRPPSRDGNWILAGTCGAAAGPHTPPHCGNGGRQPIPQPPPREPSLFLPMARGWRRGCDRSRSGALLHAGMGDHRGEAARVRFC